MYVRFNETCSWIVWTRFLSKVELEYCYIYIYIEWRGKEESIIIFGKIFNWMN
jgi:hypothetical protein